MGAASFRGACGDGIGGSFMPSVLRGSSFPPLGEAGPQTIMFVVGETEARREIPLSLARRLVASPIRTVNSEEKCRRSEERAKKLREDKLRKLHEHNERVKRIAEEKKRQREIEHENTAHVEKIN